MKCILKITEGPAADEVIIVKSGQTVTVGRHDRASFVIAGDALLSGLHFSVECDRESCAIQDLQSTNKTFVNGQAVTKKPLGAGDLIQCGNSAFRVSVEPDADADETHRTGSATLAAATNVAGKPSELQTESSAPVVGFVATTAAEVLRRFELKDEAYQSVGDTIPPEDLVKRLRQQGRLTDALRFLAYALPKRSAVWWACQCVRSRLGERRTSDDEEPLKAAETWVIQPNEENRRAAIAAADKRGHATAACWTAVGAFWSGGSMAPPNVPVVPPADNLTGKAVFGAVQLAVVAYQPENAAKTQDQFLEIALAVSSGKNTWDTGSDSE